jgi:hypothetical protein
MKAQEITTGLKLDAEQTVMLAYMLGNGYANMFGPISPLISMITSAGMLFLRAAARIASGLGAS